MKERIFVIVNSESNLVSSLQLVKRRQTTSPPAGEILSIKKNTAKSNYQTLVMKPETTVPSILEI